MSKRIPSPAAAPAPHVIDPHAVYFLDDLRHFLRFGRDRLAAERQAGRLRVARRCGRLVVLGRWLLEWIEAGEIVRDGESG